MAKTTSKPKTGAERLAELRKRRKAHGIVRREYYATPKEHAELAALLERIRC